ncbi:MAG: hypothetical protein NYU05_01450 [Aigarchaeota archaeon]|nr:hypothetical protein [Candidatus Caldarchaeales archaeon]
MIRKTNIWDMGGRTARERAALATEMLREITRDIADVSSASSALLLRELIKLYDRGVPKTMDVVGRLEEFFRNAMAERRLAEANMAAALLRRLMWLVIDEERSAVNLRGSEQVVVYDLSQLSSSYLKTMYALAVLTKTYYEAMGNGLTNRLRILLVAEECQNYIRGRRFDEPATIGERLVNEMRSFGVGVLMVSPDPVQIPWHMASDVAAVIAIGLQALPDSIRDVFRIYDVRQARRMMTGKKAYIYYNGRIKTTRPPKKPPMTLDLKTPMATIKEEKAETSREDKLNVVEKETEELLQTQDKKAEPLRLEEDELQEWEAPQGRHYIRKTRHNNVSYAETPRESRENS